MSSINRSLDATPKQEQVFDPESHEDPVVALTAEIRKLRLGERVRLPDDTLILSRTVTVGAHQERRFSVVPPVNRSSPVQRHRAVALGYDAQKTAEAAAVKALKEASSGNS